jgi:hypothetical protein
MCLGIERTVTARVSEPLDTLGPLVGVILIEV